MTATETLAVEVPVEIAGGLPDRNRLDVTEVVNTAVTHALKEAETEAEADRYYENGPFGFSRVRHTCEMACSPDGLRSRQIAIGCRGVVGTQDLFDEYYTAVRLHSRLS